MRVLFLLPFLLFCACDEKKAPSAGNRTGGGAKPESAPTLITTGTPRINDAYDGIVADLKEMETGLDEGRVPEERFVTAMKKRIEQLILVSKMAVEKEAVEMTRREHALLVQKQSEVYKQRSELGEAIREIEELLSQEKPPAGFTSDELKDRLGQKREQLRALEKDDEDLRARMQDKEDVLTGQKEPAEAETVHAHEYKAALELEKRFEALEARLKE